MASSSLSEEELLLLLLFSSRSPSSSSAEEEGAAAAGMGFVGVGAAVGARRKGFQRPGVVAAVVAAFSAFAPLLLRRSANGERA